MNDSLVKGSKQSFFQFVRMGSQRRTAELVRIGKPFFVRTLSIPRKSGSLPDKVGLSKDAGRMQNYTRGGKKFPAVSIESHWLFHSVHNVNDCYTCERI